MNTRRLTVADCQAFRRDCRLEALRRHPAAYGSTLSDFDGAPLARFGDWIEGGSVFGSFDAKNALVGIAAYERERGGNMRHRAMVVAVFVQPAARRQGRMTALLQAIEQAARAAGVLQLELQVGVDNSAALAAYARAGYQRCSTWPRAILSAGRFIDELLMVKWLGDTEPPPDAKLTGSA